MAVESRKGKRVRPPRELNPSEKTEISGVVFRRSGRITKARRRWWCGLCCRAVAVGSLYAAVSVGGEWISHRYGGFWLRYPKARQVCLECY